MVFKPKKGLKLRPYKHKVYKIGESITFKYGKKRLNGLVVNGSSKGRTRTEQIRTLRIYDKSGNFVGITQADLSDPKLSVKKRTQRSQAEKYYFGAD